MSNVLPALYAARAEWFAGHSTLPPRERRSFPRWVLRAHPEIAEHFRDELARFRTTCREVERGMQLPRRAGIGQRTLERHLPTLAQRWLALPESGRGTFLVFLERVLAEHPTPRSLERYIRSFANG